MFYNKVFIKILKKAHLISLILGRHLSHGHFDQRVFDENGFLWVSLSFFSYGFSLCVLFLLDLEIKIHLK